jgi:hypothetical protein
MREATLEEAFALDLRVRMLLREAPTGVTFDNPWSADYIGDAFGNACRELWPEHGLWRPIMERLVRATTQQVAALHRELNVLLQDRDVLPTLRVRTRSVAKPNSRRAISAAARFTTSWSRCSIPTRRRCRRWAAPAPAAWVRTLDVATGPGSRARKYCRRWSAC